MRKSYFDILSGSCSAIYSPNDMSAQRPDMDLDVLCVVPNLSLNGAQVVFIELLNQLLQVKPCNIYIISPEDGEYRTIYTSMGFTVCIRPFIVGTESFREVLQCAFDAVILNTALVHGYIMSFINTSVPVLWWIHESEEHMRAYCGDMPNPNLLSSNIHIYSVSERVNAAFLNIYGYATPTLRLAIADCYTQFSPSQNRDIVRFVIPGAYIPIKGQDILLQAISSLPAEYYNRAEFIFCGYKVPGNDEYYDSLMRVSSHLSCVKHIGTLSKNEMYDLYTNCDCVIAPSRTDSTPTTIVEALMFGKLTISSAHCGVSACIDDCVNGFVFSTVEELIKRILLIINDLPTLHSIGEAGRKVYLDYYSMDAMKESLKRIFASMEVI